MPPLPRIALLVCFSMLCHGGWAQEGIFDAPASPFDAAPATAPPADASDEEVDDSPLPNQLLEYSRRGNLQLADAIASLARTGRWSQVEQLLTQVARKNVDAATMAEMQRRIGSSLFLRMKQQTELSDNARQVLDQLAAATISQAESPERLRRAIDQLDSQAPDTLLAAARVLLGGGNAAVAELVSAAVSDTPTAPRDVILRTLMKLGPGGTHAFRQLALYASPPVRGRAIESLARIDGNAHLAELLTARHAADSTADEVSTATSALQRIGAGVPSRRAVLEYLVADFRSKQDRAQLMDNDDQTITTWSINDDRSGVTYAPSRQMLAAYRDVVDAGSRLRRIGGLTMNVVSEVLSADMAYRIILDIDWGDPDQVQAIRDAYGPAARGEALSDAIAVAIDHDDHAAAIGLIRLIDPAASMSDRSMLVRGTGALPTPLVQAAASSSNPRVRYEAALAVAMLSDGAPFAGSSRVQQTLAEMHFLGDQPSAILVETRADLIIPLEQILNQLGFQVNILGSVAQLQRRVARGGDIRMILSKTELIDASPVEMLDMTRRTDRGRDIPILFFGWEPPRISHGRWNAPTLLIERPVSTAAFDGLLDRVERRRRFPALSAVDRQSFRAAATAALSELPQAR